MAAIEAHYDKSNANLSNLDLNDFEFFTPVNKERYIHDKKVCKLTKFIQINIFG